MNTRIKFMLLLVVLVIGVAAVPAVFADDPIVAWVSNDTPVNVRSGPGMEYTTRGVLYTIAPVVGRNDFDASRACLNRATDMDMWIQIDFNGFDGWVARCIVEVDASMSALAVGTPSDPEIRDVVKYTDPVVVTPRNQPAPEGVYVVGFTSDRANIRVAPSLDSTIQDVAAAIEDFYVTGRTADNRWVKVQYGDESGWIAAYLMQLPRNWQNALPVQ